MDESDGMLAPCIGSGPRVTMKESSSFTFLLHPPTPSILFLVFFSLFLSILESPNPNTTLTTLTVHTSSFLPPSVATPSSYSCKRYHIPALTQFLPIASIPQVKIPSQLSTIF